jgi:hypothetical protein
VFTFGGGRGISGGLVRPRVWWQWTERYACGWECECLGMVVEGAFLEVWLDHVSGGCERIKLCDDCYILSLYQMKIISSFLGEEVLRYLVPKWLFFLNCCGSGFTASVALFPLYHSCADACLLRV